MSDKVSQVYVLQGLSIDNSYRHTIWFDSEDAQRSYFMSKQKYYYNELSYIRIFDGVIRVPNTPARMVNCNYIMFRNTSNLWYYAFLKEINYVSDGATELVYELDVIQTWMFVLSPNSNTEFVRGWRMQPCYIERQHVMDDKKWTNLCNEPFPLGETKYTKQDETAVTGKSWKRWYIVQSQVGTDNPSGSKPVGCTVANGNVYVGYLHVTKTKNETIELIENLQKAMDGNVISVQCIPEVLGANLTLTSTAGGKIIANEDFKTFAMGEVTMTHSTIDGYTPRNNKCFNYPFYSFYVSNQKGVSALYDFAYMSESARTAWDFTIYGDVGVGSPIILHPQSYKGLGSAHDYDLILGTMPQMQFASYYDNAFYQEEMNARVQGTLRTVQSAVSGLVGSGGNPVGAIGGALYSEFTNSLSLDALEARQDNTPANVHNLSGTNTISFNIGSVKPVFAIRHMKRYMIERLDDFLDVYGYQVNQIGKPNLSGRKAWNYVKTVGCAIKGSVPATVASKICAIHDSGVTYWKNGDNVGDYSLDNTL